MTPKKTDNRQNTFLFTRLSEQLNPKNELYLMATKLNWAAVESEFASIFDRPNFNGGQPPKPVRLIVGLMLLQNMHGLSDEAVVRGWVENPYWQYFCGYDHLQWQMPIDPSSMHRWRKRLGEEKIERILKLTVEAALNVGMVQAKDLTKTIADTTVMPKNIEYPTDSKLLERCRRKLVKEALESGLKLRQNYNLVAKKLLWKIGGYFRAKQMKRAQKALKQFKTIVGRVVRDCRRKIAGSQELTTRFEQLLKVADHLLSRTKDSKNKIYSLHEQQVECISKGKAHKPYEFGCKVALMMTHKQGSGLIVGSKAIHGNPYDGHTLKESIEQAERVIGGKVIETYLDKGYRKHGVTGVETYISGQRGLSKTRKTKLRRRSAIEPYIGHMKRIGKLGLCRLGGVMGDKFNAMLAAAGYNLKLILNYLRRLLHPIFYLIFLLCSTLSSST